MNLLPKIVPQTPAQQQSAIQTKLMHMEAKLGGELFGPLPKGQSRQFFCLDTNTWIWHEVWKDNTGTQRMVTTRYSVRPSGIIKTQDGQTWQPLTAQEHDNLVQTAELYGQRVGSQYQQMLQTA